MNNTRIGIDFGGVIIPIVNFHSKEDTSFVENKNDGFLKTPENKNAIDSIRTLIMQYKNENIFIVSKAGFEIQKLTIDWMNGNDFCQRTGFLRENLFFCEKREEKGIICEKLGITHFIDDRIHIMQILRKTVPHLYIFGKNKKNRNVSKWVTLVGDWDELLPLLLNKCI